MLQERLNQINEKIKKVQNQNPQLKPATIIAVSKKQDIEKIKEAYGLGIDNFGENYWQEAKEKIEALKDLNITWHYIGRLQSKKIKEIVGKVQSIHSVSRLEEIEKINEIAKEKNINQRILLQVNIANEPTKQGFTPEDLKKVTKNLKDYKNIKAEGLMIFPPLSEQKEETKKWYQTSQDLFNSIKEDQNPKTWQKLSMGTSSDFDLAYSMGATDLRIGEALLGKRTN